MNDHIWSLEDQVSRLKEANRAMVERISRLEIVVGQLVNRCGGPQALDPATLSPSLGPEGKTEP